MSVKQKSCLLVPCVIFAWSLLAQDDVETPMAAGVREKSPAEESDPTVALRQGCKSVHSCWCAWYQRKWGDVPNDSLEPLPQEKLDAISDEYIEQCEAAAKQNPSSSAALADLGEALLFRRRWDKARLAFTEALKHVPEKSYDAVRFRYRIAETWFGEGNREATEAELARAKAVGARTAYRGKTDWGNLVADAASFLSREDLNTYRMPRDTGFKPFPEPQKATYSESFAPCPMVAIRLKGVSNDDARITLLTKKLSWRGFKWNAGGDVLLDAVSLRHGALMMYPPQPHGKPPPKDMKAYCGLWDGWTVDAKFRLDRKGERGFAQLIVDANVDYWPNGKNPEDRFPVKLNGKTLYDGRNPFRSKGRFKLKVPLSDFRLCGENAIAFSNGRDDRLVRILFAAIVFPKAERNQEDFMNGKDESAISLDG